MKKVITLFSLIVFSVTITTAQTATKTAPKPKLTAKDSMMCGKQWHVISVEEWGVITKPPGDKNKNDMLLLNLDGTFSLILFGNKKSGTWTKTGQYIYFTDEATKEKFNYKVISVEPNKLKVDSRDPDETHSIFEYEVK
jgi:hypothetical protein